MSDEYLIPDAAYDIEQAKLARRRKIAESLIRTEASEPKMMGQWVMNPGPMGGIASALNRAAGTYDSQRLDDQERLLSQQEVGRNRDLLQRNGIDPALATAPQSIRQLLESQAKLLESSEQKAADRVEKAEEAEANRIEKGEQAAADRVARKELRETPTIHITNSGAGGRGKPPIGYRWNEDGTELEAIPGGPKDPSKAPAKPLSPAQEKAALELGSNRTRLQMLTDTFKDEYSGDVRASLEREFGKAAGGLAPKSTQDMTRWWADQAMFDELPQRHELFGATLTAGEKASWNAAAINPSLSPAKIRERLATRAKIYDAAEARMRASVEAGGKSGKQFDAAVGKPKPQAVAAGTKGTHRGKPVIMGQDGEWHYEN